MTGSDHVPQKRPENIQYDPRANRELEFPHGITNFEILRKSEKWFYVDKTSIISKLDNLPPHVVVHRPPQWGKTTFLTMLRCYYDVKEAEKFYSLFGGLEIGNTRPLTKNSYYVLMLDFSVNVSMNHKNASERQENFKCLLFSSILKFAKEYDFPAPQDLDVLFGLQTVARWVHAVGGKLMILIDEYDKATNNLIMKGADDEIVSRLKSPIGGFLEAVKEISSRYDCRSVMAGSSPIVLSDVYGASIWLDVSQRAEFGNVFGFRENDLRMALRNKGLSADEADRPLQVMQDLFAGYRFAESFDTLCNPANAVYFLDRYFKNVSFRNLVHIMPNSSSSFQQGLASFVDDIIYSEKRKYFTACLKHLEYTQCVCFKLMNPKSPVVLNNILHTIKLRDLKDDTAPYDVQVKRVVSFMYYFGLATMSSPHRPYLFQVPNQLVQKIFVRSLKPDLYFPFISSEMKKLSASFLRSLLPDFLYTQYQSTDNKFSGRALQIELENAFKWIDDIHVRTDLAQWPVAEDRCQLVFFVDATKAFVIVLKRVRPSTIDYSDLVPGNRLWHPSNTQHENWTPGELNYAQFLIMEAEAKVVHGLKIWSSDPLEYENVSTVNGLETLVSSQCLDFMKHLKQQFPGCSFAGFAVLMVGCQYFVESVDLPA